MNANDQLAGSSPGDGSLVYRGIKSVLARFLRVPMDGVALPSTSGERVESFHPATGWLRLRQIGTALMLLGMTFLVVVGSVVLAGVTGELMWLLLMVPLVLLLPLLWLRFVALRLQYDCTWYVLSDRAIRLRRGLWTIHETTITYENIQNVTMSQGPIERLFGISNIKVDTAGGGGVGPEGGTVDSSHGGKIEGIENANAIRELIMRRVRLSRSAGLGDGRAPAKADSSGAMARVLREIRDNLRETCQ